MIQSNHAFASAIVSHSILMRFAVLALMLPSGSACVHDQRRRAGDALDVDLEQLDLAHRLGVIDALELGQRRVGADDKLLRADDVAHRLRAPLQRLAQQLARGGAKHLVDKRRHEAERGGERRANRLLGRAHGAHKLGAIGNLEFGVLPEAVGNQRRRLEIDAVDVNAVRLAERAQHTVHVVVGNILLTT
jgi:hypothetical protein